MKHLLTFVLIFLSPFLVQSQENHIDSISKRGIKTILEENPYMDLRHRAFSSKPTDLRLDIPADKVVVYGVVMDWNVGKTVATIVAFMTGEASFYLKSGQIFIGGSEYKTIKDAAIDFVNSAQQYIKNTEIAPDNSLPDKDCVKFYLLSNIGIFVHQETVQNIEGDKTEWTILFHKGDQIITQYRLIVEINNLVLSQQTN
jgi:hypothetical protein